MSATYDDIVRFVKARISEASNFDRLYEDPEAWTSFQRIEVALAAEEEFDIQFSPEELAGLRSPKDVVVAVERALGMTPGTADA